LVYATTHNGILEICIDLKMSSRRKKHNNLVIFDGPSKCSQMWFLHENKPGQKAKISIFKAQIPHAEEVDNAESKFADLPLPLKNIKDLKHIINGNNYDIVKGVDSKDVPPWLTLNK
jgi:hypothetical protein